MLVVPSAAAAWLNAAIHTTSDRIKLVVPGVIVSKASMVNLRCFRRVRNETSNDSEISNDEMP